MSRLAAGTISDCFGKLMRFNRCGFRYKRTLSKRKKKSIPTQDYQDEDITKSEIYCPFINHNKSTNKEVLSSLLLSPLSIHYANKKEKNGERIYLEKFRSVTSILSQTKPPSEWFALKNWKKAQISELGDEEFKEMKKTISRKGTLFHHDVQVFFKNNETPSIEEGAPNVGYWQSISHVLQDITNVVAIESGVVHPLLGYAGTLDLIAEYKGALSVIDWKTSAKHKASLKDCYSYPQQVVAYAGAVNFDNNYPFQVCDGVIVIAYENGDPADVHHLSPEMCEGYWLEWLTRLQQYRTKFPERTVNVDDQDVNVGHEEVTLAHNLESVANSLRAKSVSSIGVPVASLGITVKDEDLIEEEEEDEELSSEEQQQVISQEQFDSSWFSLADSWKAAWENILQRIRSRGKAK